MAGEDTGISTILILIMGFTTRGTVRDLAWAGDGIVLTGDLGIDSIVLLVLIILFIMVWQDTGTTDIIDTEGMEMQTITTEEELLTIAVLTEEETPFQGEGTQRQTEGLIILRLPEEGHHLYTGTQILQIPVPEEGLQAP